MSRSTLKRVIAMASEFDYSVPGYWDKMGLNYLPGIINFYSIVKSDTNLKDYQKSENMALVLNEPLAFYGQ